MKNRPLVTGTRGSPLALKQTHEILALLRGLYPERDFLVSIKRVSTEGDRARNVPLAQISGQGVFVKDLETALLENEIDMAIHSLKDVPSQLDPRFILGAIGEREDVRDALVSRWNCPLAQLPKGARLATGSTRRAAQLRAFRPDFRIVDIRGNVDTRLRKAMGEDLDGVVLAAAGIRRLGLQERITEYIPCHVILPAVGQGALAVEIRADDEELAQLLAPIDHGPTHKAVTAERAFLQALGGGCQVPIAAWGQVMDDVLALEGMVASPDGTQIVRDKVAINPAHPEAAGQSLAEKLLASGAGEILRGWS